MTIKDMPGLVRAQVQVHLAQTLLQLERVRAELDRTTTSTGRSRVLRGLRTQLTAQLDAWEYLAEVIRNRPHVPGNVLAYQGDNPESWWCRDHQPAVFFTGEVTDPEQIEEGAECFQCGKEIRP